MKKQNAAKSILEDLDIDIDDVQEEEVVIVNKPPVVKKVIKVEENKVSQNSNTFERCLDILCLVIQEKTIASKLQAKTLNRCVRIISEIIKEESKKNNGKPNT